MKELLAEKLKEIVRNHLVSDGKVEIDGLGTFYREHIPAEEERTPDGSTILHPPKEIIRFKQQSERESL
ncbi:MAG: HU family DNA-binding protein [Balneolales bacterium]|nr:HU family DNA-binding protein [Balneolales bacterium]